MLPNRTPKGSFSGTLSSNGRLLTDKATGAAREDQDGGFPWIGYVRYPAAVRERDFFTPSVRLDCADGRTLLIEMGDDSLSRDGQWVESKFYSYGLTRRRHHAVWSWSFGHTTLRPSEWKLFREGLSALVEQIENAFDNNTVSPKTGIAEFDPLPPRSKLSALAVVAHSLHGQHVPLEERTAVTRAAHAAVYAVVLRMIKREIGESREALSAESGHCVIRPWPWPRWRSSVRTGTSPYPMWKRSEASSCRIRQLSRR